MPSLSPDRSQVRGDVRDRLGRPKEDYRYEVPEESSGSGKTEPGRGGKALQNIQKEKGKDRWGEQGGGGYQKDYVRGPKPREFEAGPIVFKDPLHELLKKIEHERFFTLPADNIPCPKVKDNKYRCSYHASRGHLTTWSVGGWNRVRDEVVGAESWGLKEIGRYGDRPNVSIREGRVIWPLLCF
ncbi:hypothetical protein RHGRI_024472 [Rhododendron griersonianum]|uniref:Uncharacterized protein n=1 Tax=Rhododendron griersonianum TaxID=479676 RepID=A0AAV6J9M2_9ERIC|nr:hypothetical protein RHGRI_024472 [Rhododendron griersonianum]